MCIVLTGSVAAEFKYVNESVLLEATPPPLKCRKLVTKGNRTEKEKNKHKMIKELRFHMPLHHNKIKVSDYAHKDVTYIA